MILVVPHDPAWALQFAEEAQQIHRALGAVVLDLHHIGSTAIQGIHAKPVIDMLLAVGDLQVLDQQAGVLMALGYEAKGEFGIPGRRYFSKDSPSGARSHQLHAFQAGSHGFIRHLAFRDYMNAHPEVAQAYGRLKQQLASQYPLNRTAYMDGKDPFIRQHEALAMDWFLQQRAA
ncbi:GrpB family protein [Parachitinimonas caeni]|uniref:GrpB family protein n=1 Tax=Parachitinimonas caeni TaxID=3031301 RepID=A0ABT7E1F9_9NEIS|nr:GrpB family protein [Parachitinimonas caeni]MDK2126148.1 GrpB family protein [Parachitinimonas caeni]